MATEDRKQIKLPEPHLNGGVTINEAFANRRSFRGGIDSRKISMTELSNLLWAANGINRPDGGRTAPSAVGKKDIDIYAITEEGAYFFNPEGHTLTQVSTKDLRPAISGGQDFVNVVPVVLLLVSNTNRFAEVTSRPNAPDLSQYISRWSMADAGIVSQNINLFCAGHGLATITRAMMFEEELRKELNLDESQLLVLNNAVGYPVE